MKETTLTHEGQKVYEAADGRLYVQCEACEKLVRIKPLMGTLHVCLTSEELAAKIRSQR